VTVIKGLEWIAVVVFVLCPLRTGTQVLVFVASIAVFLICHFVLAYLDDNYIAEHMKDGYWPSKPVNWSPLPDRHDADEQRKSD